jgi:hypothetical protein
VIKGILPGDPANTSFDAVRMNLEIIGIIFAGLRFASAAERRERGE